MILVFGSINIDLVARVEKIARPGETVLSRRADRFFGGKGCNQAVAAARASRGSPQKVFMVAAVGDDPFGHACVDNLRSNGVDVSGVHMSSDPTGCAFITVDAAGENAITVASGANMTLLAADLADDLLSKASVLVLQMEVECSESLAIARRARQHGVKVIWNFAPAPADIGREQLVEHLQATDLLIVNEHEAIVTANVASDDPAGDHVIAAAILAASYGLICIVTSGPLGATAIMPDGTLLRASALSVAPIDTTGAGDTFIGVLAANLAARHSLHVAMQQACVAASLSCLAMGAQTGMPTRDELENHCA